MSTVTVSPKFQVVIPRRIREALGLKPGMKFQVVQLGERIELLPIERPRRARGFLRGIDTEVPREPDRA